MANLYLVFQDINNDYDTFDSFVVCANSEEEARQTDPSGFRLWKNGNWYFQFIDGNEELQNEHYSWVNNIEDVKVEKIGKADKSVPLGVVISSFNAG